ncbi:cation:proton antiporter [Candidatus Peregrinibacteria bacterium]|nr:cation:proton antiporter [Candidatus Peregrinibacteria bacterium]
MCAKRSLQRNFFLLFIIGLVLGSSALAATEGAATETGVHSYASTLFWMAILLLFGKFASLVERIGQPSVLGELVIGVALGNLTLLGITAFESAEADPLLRFLAELGVIILLFQIGLESNIQKMGKVGIPAFLVAAVGVVVPFVLGTYVVGPYLLPGLTSQAYLFLGAALTATSVGITARVFKDLGKLQTPEAQIVLGAAVIDDVIGLVILAVVSAIATAGTVSAGVIALITGKAVFFLIGSIVLGVLLAPWLGWIFSTIHTGVGMKFTLAITFGLLLAAAAQEIGLAPIVGAFAAGLVLDPVHFRYFQDFHVVDDVRAAIKGSDPALQRRVQEAIKPHAERHIEYLIEPLGHFLVPLFFVMTGMSVNLLTLFDPSIILVALGVTIVAFVGKIVAGLAAGKRARKWLVGWGMVPRGEVGLIFATIGRGLGVVTDELFSVIVIVVILTTLLTPPILAFQLRGTK